MKTTIAPEEHLTSHEVAELLQMNPSSINNWVRTDKLHAFRTPGGHRRILASDLAAFLVSFGMPIPVELEGMVVKRVLWVSPDDRPVMKLLFRKFTRAEATICFAGSAAEGLLMVGESPPDVVVIDERCKDVERLHFVDVIKSSEPTEHVRIVYVDTAISAKDIREGEAAGVSMFLAREGDNPLRVLDKI